MMTLTKFNWNEKLSIGNPDVDHDHRKLLDVINELIELIELKKDRKEFARILSRMTDYSLTHFKAEETFMEKFEFPEIGEHKKLHFNYIHKVSMYNHDLLSPTPPDPKEIITFLNSWWQNHILKVDSVYEEYRKKINSPVKYFKSS